MITFSFDIAKPHIEACLKLGYEKLELAKLLKKEKKYPGAIVAYVEAYEEIGQALFLTEKINDSKEINENDWNELTKPGTHQKKILIHYIARKDQLEKNTNEEYEKVQKSKIGKIFVTDGTREDNIKAIEKRISIYNKLHKLRQTFNYSHDLQGRIMSHDTYDKKDLESLCYVLESECFTSYYVVKLGLEFQAITLPNDTEDTSISKIVSLPSVKKLKELFQKSLTSSNYVLFDRGLKFINSF